MLIAVDHGNYSIKTPNFSFVAGLAEHTVRPITDDYLEYDGRFWTLTETLLHYMRDKTQDNRYFVLTLFAIIKELEKGSALSPSLTVELAAGLPPEHYSVLKDRFASYFLREKPIRFIYKGRPHALLIPKVFVFPQCYAAVISNSAVAIRTMRLYLIDIGGYTTDVLLLRNGKPDLQFCRSLECGTITMNNEIIRKINARYDLRIDDEHISAVLNNEETILPAEVKAEICAATKRHADIILNQLRELQVDLRSNPAVFFGGGSKLLRPYLESSPLVADELRARFTVWLEVLLRRARTKYLKREAIHIPQMSLEELQEDEWPVAPEPAIPKAGFEFEEDRYNQAFSALSPREQQLLTLLLVYDYSPAEAATLLSYKKIQTLYSDKHRAIKKMRAILCNKEDYHRKE